MATDQTTPTERVPSNTEVEQFTSNISTMNLAVLKDFQELFCAMLEYLKISPINNDTKASLQSCINYVKQQRPDAGFQRWVVDEQCDDAAAAPQRRWLSRRRGGTAAEMAGEGGKGGW